MAAAPGLAPVLRQPGLLQAPQRDVYPTLGLIACLDAQRGLSAGGQTSLPFEIQGADVLILDDVLYTGRTIRAVINELFDYGRPASVRLAVLVDRGGRQLPIQADFAAARVSLPNSQSLALARLDNGEFSFEVQAQDESSSVGKK